MYHEVVNDICDYCFEKKLCLRIVENQQDPWYPDEDFALCLDCIKGLFGDLTTARKEGE